MPANRKIVVFDASPKNDPTPWMEKACQDSGAFLLDINAVSKHLAQDPEARQLLLARGPVGPDTKLARHYLAALEKLAGDAKVVVVHSVVWIDYGAKPVAAVLDFDNLELEREQAKKLGVTMAHYDELVAKTRGDMEGRAKRVLRPEAILALPQGAADAKKAELAAAHVRKLAG